MADIEVDVLVLGWGKGGKTLVGALGRAGRTVAVVERSEQMQGGSCININCVPTKALIHKAETRPKVADAQEWFTASVGWRDDLVAKLRARNHAMLADVDTVTLVTGHARFVGPRQVEVQAGADRLLVDAENVVIGTGSVPILPAIGGAAESTRVHDSTSLQHVDPLPRRLAVVGGGYVGLEFAGMFAHFGSQVTLLDHYDRLLPREDRDGAEAVRALLEEQGVEGRPRRLGHLFTRRRRRRRCDRPGRCGRGHRAARGPGRRRAAGDRAPPRDRRPRARSGRGPDRPAGLRRGRRAAADLGTRRLRRRRRQRRPQFTYVSLDDHRIVLDQLTGAGSRTTADRVAVPTTTFLSPPLGRVGLTEDEARALGRNVLVGVKRVATSPRCRGRRSSARPTGWSSSSSTP